MSQPVKLSDALVLDARLAGETMERSIAGQVEFWARLGSAIEPVLQGDKVMALRRQASTRPLSELLDTINTKEGNQRLAQHLDALPFPHYEAHPDEAGLLVRVDGDGRRTVGRFVNRVFQTVKTHRATSKTRTRRK